MNTHNNFTKYSKIFKEWDDNRTELSKEEFTYKPLENEEFRACYLPKTKNKEPFYKARHSLPKYWFCSNKGTIISVRTGHAEVITGSFTEKARSQVSFCSGSDSHVELMTREAVIALVFNDVYTCTEQARERIEEMGLEAFRRSSDGLGVELHHGNGYVYPPKPTTMQAVFNNIAVNCDNLQLVTRLEHYDLHRSRKAVA